MPKKYENNTTAHGGTCDKPFPRRCPECGKNQVQPATIAYDAAVKHDGRLHAFHIPTLQVNECTSCGEILFSAVTDDQISEALRRHVNLLSPQQIRDAIRLLGLKQKEFGERIGVAPETVSRWISGTHIQSRAMDNLMRLFFAFENVRSALACSSPDKHLGVLSLASVVQPTPFPGGSAASMRCCARFTRSFSKSVHRRKESFQLFPALN